MSRPKLEVADVFRRHGAAWRAANKAHLSLAQRRVMTAIEVCRTAALGGHVERCEDCAHTRIAYNSCRNRHCPKCQWPAAQAWMAAREAELLPVPYFHVVFTLPAALGAIAYQNKAKLYGLLFTAAARRSPPLPAIPSTLAPTSASPLCCTLGARTSSTIRMCIASCRVADYRRTASAGSPVGTASFFRSACSRACFAIASVTTTCSPMAIAPTSSNSVDGLSMCHRREPRTPTAIAPARPPPTTNRHLAHAAVVA